MKDKIFEFISKHKTKLLLINSLFWAVIAFCIYDIYNRMHFMAILVSIISYIKAVKWR